MKVRMVAAIVGGDNPTAGVISQLGANLPPGLGPLLTDELRSVVQTRNPGPLASS
jgi:hypothetical protein